MYEFLIPPEVNINRAMNKVAKANAQKSQEQIIFPSNDNRILWTLPPRNRELSISSSFARALQYMYFYFKSRRQNC
jgi:hypothetical protein